ncbi:hypothetical protein ANO14919_119470 [Xylariales sp. No.14919]|nr:hypothetical protein ANO14919_119470 [Xylariales sp. No.14919]
MVISQRHAGFLQSSGYVIRSKPQVLSGEGKGDNKR